MATKKGKARTSATSSAKAATNPGAQAFGAAAAALVQLDGVASTPAKEELPRRPVGWRVLEEFDPVADVAEVLVWALGLASRDGIEARELPPLVCQRLHRACTRMLRHGDSFEAAMSHRPGMKSLRSRVLEFARDRHLMKAAQLLRSVTPGRSLESCMVRLAPVVVAMGRPGWSKVLDLRTEPPADMPPHQKELWRAAKFGWELATLEARGRPENDYEPRKRPLSKKKNGEPSPLPTTGPGMSYAYKQMSFYLLEEHPFTLLADRFL